MLNTNEKYQYKRITTNTLIKTGSGQLGGFIVVSGSPTITVWDNTSAASDEVKTFKVIDALSGSAGTAYPCPIAFVNGCYFSCSGGSVTVFYN